MLEAVRALDAQSLHFLQPNRTFPCATCTFRMLTLQIEANIICQTLAGLTFMESTMCREICLWEASLELLPHRGELGAGVGRQPSFKSHTMTTGRPGAKNYHRGCRLSSFPSTNNQSTAFLSGLPRAPRPVKAGLTRRRGRARRRRQAILSQIH